MDDITDTYFTLADDRLRSIKEMLVKAESYKRRGKFDQVYDIFKQIADYFESERDYNTMYYFYDLGENVARRVSNKSEQCIHKFSHPTLLWKVFQKKMQEKWTKEWER